MTTSRREQESASERAMTWLRDEILQVPWDQESFLSENEIARESGVSRTPVREAVLQLEAGGLLRRIPFKGAHVPALTSSDIDEIMEVRRVIGRWASAKVAATRPEIGESLLDLIERQRDAQEDEVRFIELDVEFHRTIVHAAENPTLERVYQSQRSKQHRLGLQALLADEHRTNTVLDEHTAIARAIRDGDPDQAEAAAAEHVTSTARLLGSR